MNTESRGLAGGHVASYRKDDDNTSEQHCCFCPCQPPRKRKLLTMMDGLLLPATDAAATFEYIKSVTPPGENGPICSADANAHLIERSLLARSDELMCFSFRETTLSDVGSDAQSESEKQTDDLTERMMKEVMGPRKEKSPATPDRPTNRSPEL